MGKREYTVRNEGRNMEKNLRELLTERIKQRMVDQREILGEKVYKDLKLEIPITEDMLIKMLRFGCKVVWDSPKSERRNYRFRIDYDEVVEVVPGRYFKFTECEVIDKVSDEESEYTFEGIDNVVEVYPKQVTTTIYEGKV